MFRNVAEGTRLAALKGKPGSVYFLTDGDDVVFEDFITEMLETQVALKPLNLAAVNPGRDHFEFLPNCMRH